MEENSKDLYEALLLRLGKMVAENVHLELRVHELMEDYNRVVKQLQGKGKHDNSPTGYTLGELTEALDKCELLKKDYDLLQDEYKRLEKMCIQLQTERNGVKTHVADCEHQKEELLKHIHRFNNSEFVEMGVACTHRGFASGDNPVIVGGGVCSACRRLIKMDLSGKKCVLCACRYDNTKGKEAQENKATDE